MKLVPGLERGLNILRLFKRSRPIITPPEIARELRIPRSTVHRLLQTLEDMGFLCHTDGGAYVLGSSVLSIGFEYLSSLDIVQLSNPVMARLRDQTQGSTHLVVRNGTEIVYLSRHPSPAALTSNVSVGSSLPAHATVIGRMLLADLSAAELRALYRNRRLSSYTDKTPTTLAALEKLLVDDRRLGYAISTSFYERGVASVAAPVRNHTGRVVAAINVTMIDGVVDGKMLRGSIREQTCAAAAEISGMLGAIGMTESPEAKPHAKTQVLA